MHRWVTIREPDPYVQRGLLIIGQAIFRRRVGSGMTQRQLAFYVGLNQSTISRLERGELRAMRLTTIARVIHGVNLRPEDLRPGGPPGPTRRIPGQPL